MRRISRTYTLWVAGLIVIALISSCAKEEVTLTIVWAEWDPANFLVELAKDFTAETGIQVVVDPVPWGQFETKVFTAFAARADTYDIVIGDSQWLGRGAKGGHYVELTDWMKTNNIDAGISPKALKYLGEYPKGSGRYYAVPAEADCNGFAYRKDLFEDPKTYDQLRDIAEFFTRPESEPPLYGIAMWLGKDYDSVTMGFQQVMWSFGGSYGDEQTHKVEGILNNEAGVKALEFYVDLAKSAPPGSENYYWNECLTAFQQGKVAMAMDYFAFMPGLVAEEKSPYAKSTGFFAGPGQTGADGQFRRYISIGGQGMSVSAYSKHQDEAKQVLESDEFLKMNPYNPAFVESMDYVRDFWALPEYAELLQKCQTEWNAAVTGQKTPKEAMDTLAKDHEAIFKAAGYYSQ
jgi:multiple sugar transport system substrate-binding protein